MRLSSSIARGFLTNQHCRYPLIDTLERRQQPPSRRAPNPSSSGQRDRKWKALSTVSGRVQVLLHQSTIASHSRYRSKCAAGCALIRDRQLKPPSELERVVTPGAGRKGEERGRWRGRRRVARTLVPLVLLLSVDVDAARWRERQLGVDGFEAWRLFAKRGSGASVEQGGEGGWRGYPDWKSRWNFGRRLVAIGLATWNN